MVHTRIIRPPGTTRIILVSLSPLCFYAAMSLVPHAGRLATVALLLRLLRQLPDLLILPFVGYALAVRKLWRDVCHGGSPEGARVGI